MVLGGLFALGKYGVWQPIRRSSVLRDDLRNSYAKKQMELKQAEADLRRYDRMYHWIPAHVEGEAIRGETSEERTKRYLKQVIDRIEKDVHFTVTHYNPHKTRSIGSRSKSLDVASCSVKGEGSFKSVMDFLLEVYKTDDLIYVTGATIGPDSRDRDRVQAELKLEAPVITRTRKLAELTSDLKPSGPKTAGPATGRLADPLDAYALLTDWKPFERYDPPPPQPTAACCVDRECLELTREDCDARGGEFMGGPCRSNTCTPALPAPIADTGDPDRDAKIVRGFMGNDIMVSLRVAHGRESVEEREYVGAGQEFDGGTLILVHRLGAVVRKTDGGPTDEADGGPQDWLYQWGEPLSACRLLNEVCAQHSEFRLLQHEIASVQGPPPTGPPETADDTDS